ncbi:hypothetical protein BXZ70DRAFT_647750 [Cristinia sonorae]|uniref:Uncharacterized protein n=1 Tax=Cristinia sonorae TaxID=1940300 RepID=A0A8K0UE19_9AGAR|nr:hypothetical protein BXZ70DRAFT_647750 [Cristinia sonorae]
MHRVFLVAELLDNIFTHVVGHQSSFHRNASWDYGVKSSDYRVHRDIKALRRTATIFRELCLNALWRLQYSLIPLFGIVGLLSDESDETNYEVIRRDLSPDDLPVLMYYSSRIFFLHLVGEYSSHPSLRGKFRFDDSLLSHLIFPKLQHFGEDEHPNLTQFIIATSRNITSLNLTRSPSPCIIHLLHSNASSLTNLMIDAKESDSEITPSQAEDIGRLVQGVPLLQSLWIYTSFPINLRPIWKSLHQLRNLTHLYLELSTDVEILPIPFHTTFSALITLDIFFPKIQQMVDLFSLCTFTSLTSVMLNLEGYYFEQPLQTVVAALFSAIARSITSPTFKDIHFTTLAVHSENHHLETDPPARISSDHLRPLLALSKSLRSLLVDMHWLWDLDDRLICDMASAWPGLETLAFMATEHWVTPSRVTLRGLEALSRCCPRLRHLDIAFDGSLVDVIETPLTRRAQLNNTLVYLSVGCSVVDSPDLLAARLISLFPSLEQVCPYRCKGETRDEDLANEAIVEAWGKVQNQITLLNRRSAAIKPTQN